jgi:hypothetical protein
MATMPNPPAVDVPDRGRWTARLRVPEMWASLAIGVIWLAVVCDALFGSDIVSTNAGGQSTRLPSALVVAFFAYFATRVVARYGFTRSGRDGD